MSANGMTVTMRMFLGLVVGVKVMSGDDGIY